MSGMDGWVNFPINDARFQNTGEGGMFVKLVVCDDRDYDDRFGVCCGVHVIDMMSESLIADDRYPLDDDDDYRRMESFHFPHLKSNDFFRYNSREYLAAIVLGSTDWSGWDDERGDYWSCTFDDLSDEGKALYRQLEALYPGCTLHLLTFLDT